jgi:hypothetical protein
MRTIYRVHEGSLRLQYYNNAFDYYTFNTLLKCKVNAVTLHLKTSQHTTKTKIDTSEIEKQRCRQSMQP